MLVKKKHYNMYSLLLQALWIHHIIGKHITHVYVYTIDIKIRCNYVGNLLTFLIYIVIYINLEVYYQKYKLDGHLYTFV